MERIGLIAGGGELPIIFAKEAHKRGAKVIGFAIKEMALPEFDEACDKVHRLNIWQIKKFIFLLVTERIKKIAMLGKVDKSIIYDSAKKDKEAMDVLKESKDKRDYSLLDRVTHKFKKLGIDVVDVAKYMPDLLPSKGILTKRHPSQKENEDITFGLKIAKEIAKLDIGQTVIIKDKAIVSVEAMEGTDKTIERAAKLSKGGFVVIKVSRPRQDMRWDVPVVGPETIKLIARNSGKALAMEEKRMFLVDKETCIKVANGSDISIVVV